LQIRFNNRNGLGAMPIALGICSEGHVLIEFACPRKADFDELGRGVGMAAADLG
jgi:hypothetical protein